jgi:DNA helicase HerA-like ATPase
LPSDENELKVMLGSSLSSWKEVGGEQAYIPLSALSRHVAIFGQSGSGKTVVLKRLVEEAALQGVSSLVIDCSGDLALLAAPWPELPETFTEDDMAKAGRFHKDVDVVVWTPFGSANPYKPPKVPDLKGIAKIEAKEDFNIALDMAVETVTSNLGLSMKLKDSDKSVLRTVFLRCTEDQSEPGLDSLIRQLDILREDTESYENPPSYKKSVEGLWDRFSTAAKGNPDLMDNASTAISELLDPTSARPRVSVVYLPPSTALEKQQQAVQSILTTVYSTVSVRHPKFTNGLIVIDEAKEFAPSMKSTPSKSIIIRLATMLRKYGYGLVLASQSVKSVDNNIVNSFGTKIVGQQSSQTAINSAEEILNATTDLRLGSLGTGQFYATGSPFNNCKSKPAKIKASLCLTWHPVTPPEEDRINEIARQSAKRIPKKV